jgi:hypothetical protein
MKGDLPAGLGKCQRDRPADAMRRARNQHKPRFSGRWARRAHLRYPSRAALPPRSIFHSLSEKKYGLLFKVVAFQNRTH